MRHEFDGLTGRLFEAEVLGEIMVVARSREYRSYTAALAEVRQAQPWEPTDPRPRLASDLHASVCEALGVENYSEVALYTAVGSALDFFHGVDAFVEWRGEIVTIDLTVNPYKVRHKADVIVGPVDFESNLEATARTIADRLMERLGLAFGRTRRAVVAC